MFQTVCWKCHRTRNAFGKWELQPIKKEDMTIVSLCPKCQAEGGNDEHRPNRDEGA